MALNKCPNIGQLDKAMVLDIVAPVGAVATTVGPYRLADVTDAAGAALSAVFPGGTVRGRGKIHLIAEDEADRDVLKAAADATELGLVVNFYTDDGATLVYSQGANQIAKDGDGLFHTTFGVTLEDRPEYGVVTFTYSVPVGLAKVALAWAPNP
jgi:hypothetical protein